MSERRYLVDSIRGVSLHAEGAHFGRACLTLRFADRETPDAGERYTAMQILARLVELDATHIEHVVLAGALAQSQWDAELAGAIRGAGFTVLAEIDGTQPLAAPVDWLTVAPRGAATVLAANLPVDEVKIVVDDRVDADVLDHHAARLRCKHYFVRAADPTQLAHTIALIEARPRWRLSVPLPLLTVPGR